MISNKQALCENYKKILIIIGKVNKGFILQKQLIQYLLILELAKNESNARKIIQELEDGKIIKKINFIGTKNKIIILKKFGIAFIEKKRIEQVSTPRTCTTNQRYFRSIILNHIILNFLQDKTYANVLAYAKKKGIYSTLKAIHSNIGYDDLNYYKYMLNSDSFGTHLNREYIQNLIDQSEEKKIQQLSALKKSHMKRAGIKENEYIQPASKPEKEKNLTLEILKKKDIYILFADSKTYIQKEYIIATKTRRDVKVKKCFYSVSILDTTNTLTTSNIRKRIIDAYSTLWNMYKGYTNDTNTATLYDIKHINFTIYCWNEIRAIELRKYIKEYIMTINNKNDMSVNVISVDVNENYLGNIKRLIY